MTQEERWKRRYDEVKGFIETNRRNPSKHDDAERGLYCNWLKHQRKLYNAGEMIPLSHFETAPLYRGAAGWRGLRNCWS